MGVAEDNSVNAFVPVPSDDPQGRAFLPLPTIHRDSNESAATVGTPNLQHWDKLSGMGTL